MMSNRLVNIFGAMALSVGDDLTALAQSHLPREEPAAALTLIGRSPGRTIRDLSVDLGLSHAATVRLIDRLELDGLVQRGRSEDDGRSVSLTLTKQGKVRYAEILTDRHTRLAQILSRLDEGHKNALERVAEIVLAGLVSDGMQTSPMCRFCDVEACKTCPIDSVRSVGLQIQAAKTPT